VGGYRERRHRALEDVARRAAERAVQEGREISLEPMDARERRIIHVTLKSHPRVYTFSQGEGLLRYVVVAPRREGVEPPASEAVDDRNPGAADQVA
ncbi:MAG: hypothetical protein HY660_03245, partial [Armatimonadetes bacterium]|nr:hypothetical protein [Armatimonadota bacterium]